VSKMHPINRRMKRMKGLAIPAKFLKFGTPGWIRTSDLLLRRQ
jgi:hypothetical protein